MQQVAQKPLTKAQLPGDWKSGNFGKNKRSHLFVWKSVAGSRDLHKLAACGARTDGKYRSHRPRLNDCCYDCLVYGASGR